MDSSSNLPSDIIFEILSRTSLKTLDTCKSVSKYWNQQIYEATFMPNYCKNTSNIYGYFIQSLDSCKYVNQFISLSSNESQKVLSSIKHDKKCWEKDVKIEASSMQGILCVVMRKFGRDRYHICKPSTEQWQALPNPKMRYTTVKVALVVLHSNPVRFKIVRISYDWRPQSVQRVNHSIYHCEIFDSKNWRWKKADNILLPSDVLFNHNNQSVHAGGLIYWRTSDDKVLAFNLDQETYFRFHLPELKRNEWDYPHEKLIGYDGKLSFIYQTPQYQKIELWTVNNSKDSRWSLVKEFKVGILKKYDAVAFYNHDIALMKSHYEMLFYKLQDSSFTEAKLDFVPYFDHVFPFRSDLEPINLRDGCL